METTYRSWSWSSTPMGSRNKDQENRNQGCKYPQVVYLYPLFKYLSNLSTRKTVAHHLGISTYRKSCTIPIAKLCCLLCQQGMKSVWNCPFESRSWKVLYFVLQETLVLTALGEKEARSSHKISSSSAILFDA